MAKQFLDTLVLAVKSAHGRIRVVITLRADFYDRPLSHSGVGELLRDGTQVITPMTSDQLERAVTGPVERLGVVFESAVVAELVREMVDRAGALPLLQYTLTELFDRRQGNRITNAAYDELGGVHSLPNDWPMHRAWRGLNWRQGSAPPNPTSWVNRMHRSKWPYSTMVSKRASWPT